MAAGGWAAIILSITCRKSLRSDQSFINYSSYYFWVIKLQAIWEYHF